MSSGVGVRPFRHRRALSFLLCCTVLLPSLDRLAAADGPLVTGPIRRVTLPSLDTRVDQTPKPIRRDGGSESSQERPLAVPIAYSLQAEGKMPSVPDQLSPGGGSLPIIEPVGPVLQRSQQLQTSGPWMEEGHFLGSQPSVLDGRRIGCLSAEKWIPADLLRSRGCTILQLYGDEKDDATRQAARAMATFLNIQAGHQEDIGAASALRAYYTRIALAEKLALTFDSLQRIDEEEQKQLALQEGGMAAATDLSHFDRLRLQIQDDQLLINTQDRRLRCVLSELTGVDYEMSSILQEELQVVRCALDCAGLQRIALRQRKDLRSWLYISRQINEVSAPQFAKMLPTLVGGWTLPMPTICGLKQLLCPPDFEQLAANMRREVQLTVETHQRWICQAVLEKYHNTLLGYDRIEVAQEVVHSWQSRIAQLIELEQQGVTKPEEMAEAQAELLRARAEEIDRRLETRNAEIDLAEAVGCISDRCCNGQAWLPTGME